MSQNVAAKDKSRETAIVLLAEGDKSAGEIAEACGVNRRTIIRWQQEPEFAERVQSLKESNKTQLEGDGVRRKDNRINIYQDTIDRIQTLIKERADEMADEVAGGGTGLLTKDYKGKDADRAVYKFDAALVTQLNATLRQAAQEMGQWTEKQEVTGAIENAVKLYLPDNGRDNAESRD